MSNHAELIRDMYPSRAVTSRGRRHIEFDLGGGQKRRVLTIEPLHTASNQEINTTWQTDSGAWQWKITASDFWLNARSVLNAGDIVQWVHPESGENLTLQPLALNWVNHSNDSRQQITQPQAVTATANDAQLTWSDGYGAGRHFRYTAHPVRLTKELIIDSLASLPAPTVANPYLEIEFILKRSSGVTLFVNGQAWDNSTKTSTANRIEFRLANGTVAWRFEDPGATDANGDYCPGIFQLRRQGNNRYCTVRIPKAWIDTAAFPIYLDPTLDVRPDATAGKDTKLISSLTNNNYGITGTLLGATTDKMLVEFDASSIPATATCDSATLSLFQAGSSAALAFTLTAYSIASGNAAWIEGTKNNATAGTGEPCWNYREYNTVNWAGSAGMATSGTDYEAAALGSVSGNRSDANGTAYAISLTTTRIAGWFGASNTNYGLLITTSAGCGNMGSSDNATAAYRPRMVIDYTEASTTKTITDSGSGADAIGNVSVSLALADTGSGAESFSGAASLALLDSGAGSDTLAAVLAALGVADAGAGGDSLGINAAVTVSDIGSGADSASQITVTLTVTDTGAGSDAVNLVTEIIKQISDSGSGTDSLSIAISPITITDNALGADSLTIQATINIADFASGADAVNLLQAVYKVVSDAAVGTDTISGVSVSLTVPDSGAGADLVGQILAWVMLTESGSGVDVAVAYDSAMRIATISFTIARRIIAFAFSSRVIEFELASREINFDLSRREIEFSQTRREMDFNF